MGSACGMKREKRNNVIRKSKEHLEDQGMSGSIILKWILKETGWEVWTCFFSIRIRTCCGMFRIWQCIFGYHTIHNISS